MQLRVENLIGEDEREGMLTGLDDLEKIDTGTCGRMMVRVVVYPSRSNTSVQ